MLMDNVTGWIKKLIEAGVSLIALAIVIQVIFGTGAAFLPGDVRSEEHTSELQSRRNLVCRLLLEKKNNNKMVSEENFVMC